MQERFGLTILFIAHNLAVVRQVCTSVAVIHAGRIVEQGQTLRIFKHPEHPYTRSLLEAVPIPEPPASESQGVMAYANWR
jgi:ABC-type oligopeptide transport system ATPase subunit